MVNVVRIPYETIGNTQVPGIRYARCDNIIPGTWYLVCHTQLVLVVRVGGGRRWRGRPTPFPRAGPWSSVHCQYYCTGSTTVLAERAARVPVL